MIKNAFSVSSSNIMYFIIKGKQEEIKNRKDKNKYEF
jgi:hypothetical protein